MRRIPRLLHEVTSVWKLERVDDVGPVLNLVRTPPARSKSQSPDPCFGPLRHIIEAPLSLEEKCLAEYAYEFKA